MSARTQPEAEPAWRRRSQMVGMLLLTVAHVSALVAGGYDEWPAWAAVANFAGLALFLVPAAVAWRSRRS